MVKKIFSIIGEMCLKFERAVDPDNYERTRPLRERILAALDGVDSDAILSVAADILHIPEEWDKCSTALSLTKKARIMREVKNNPENGVEIRELARFLGIYPTQ